MAPREGKHGDVRHASDLTRVWCDVDAKCFAGGNPEAREALNLIPLRPTYVVDSGNGYHAYWVLAELVAMQRFAEAQDVLIGIRAAIGRGGSEWQQFAAARQGFRSGSTARR